MGARNKLTATQIKHFGPGKYNDGAGLWLHKRHDGGGQWFLRVTIHGRRREMGLGGLYDVSLAEARDEADHWRSVARSNKDPIKERARIRREQERGDHTLASVTEEAFKARQAELKGDGKAGRWLSPLTLHVLPKLGRVPIEEIDQQDIKNTLAPIWHTKAHTARKAIDRLGIVLKYAAALDLDVDLQATMKARALLGKQRHETQNIPSMKWEDVPAFYSSLDEPTVGNLALQFLILTAARTSEVRFCQEEEIDGDIWTVPGKRMKAGTEHRVPLPQQAQDVLDQARTLWQRNGFFFWSRKTVISDAAMSGIMKRREMTERPHGFRSSFRTWCAEATDTPREIAETALAHKVGGKVERAYRRTDYIDQRRELMQRWADHVVGAK
ncbi:site-specific integrase [Ruegeria sp. HKCCD7303]|uniref:tyrosine-type recombinase/integrase n=1 Tax=Ruegeria sp. HKCCD7303 TaxID=2683013 RepID=UPI00149250C2|nr:site-specific integrase [Ruegeria sp. HKCCD7303]NOD67600.1 integrase arm-type DNA-binding domain-containing protein [Ruegeria sp. HKCCD7303]